MPYLAIAVDMYVLHLSILAALVLDVVCNFLVPVGT